MPLRKSKSPAPPRPAAPPAATGPAPAPRRRRLWVVLVLVPVVGLIGWGAWSLLVPDPLRDARDALDRRDFRTADELLAKRLLEKPNDPRTHLLAARAARRAGDFGRAHELLRLYKERHGADAGQELESRMLRAQAGDAAEADKLFAEYDANPGAPDAPLLLEAYLEGKLRALAPRGEGRMEGDAEYAALAVVEANAAKLHRAIDLWLGARPGRADQVQGRLWRARVSFAANKHDEGVVALREAVALAADHLEARFQLAQSTSLTDPDGTRRHLEALRDSHPDNPFILLGLANTYRMLGRGPDARRIYEGLLAGPHRVNVLVELGTLDMEEGKFPDAEKRLSAALELAPNAPATNIAMSRYYQLVGKPEEAAKYRKRFEELDAEQKKPRP